MSALIRGAAATALAWNRVYSAGLPDPVRAMRRAELASDLHEHAAWDADHDVPSADTAVLILWRVLAGAPADLAWRVRVARTTSPGVHRSITGRIPIMLATIVRRAGLAFTAVLALFLAYQGVALLFEGISNGEGWKTVYGAHHVTAGALLGAGLVLHGRRPALGVGLTVAGALFGALAVYWMLPISMPIALVAIAAIVGHDRHVRGRVAAAA